MHISTKEGIIELPKTSPFKKLFCKHEIITGENCSSSGLRMISGEQRVTACKKCGHVFGQIFIPYE
jgi:RNase P subunit RPR2